MSNDIGGVWRTVGGRRIFIKDGQDLSTAMRESGKFQRSDMDYNKGINDIKQQMDELEKQMDGKPFLEKVKYMKQFNELQKKLTEIEDEKYKRKVYEQIKKEKENATQNKEKIEQQKKEIEQKEKKYLESIKKDDKHNQLQNKSNEVYKKLTENERVSINDYTLEDYISINKELKHNNLSAINKEKVKNIDNVIKKYDNKEENTFYRGIPLSEVKNLKIGDEYNPKQYQSTSYHEKVAEIYANNYGKGHGAMIVYNGKMDGVFIGTNSAAFITEAEFLVSRHQKTIVKNIYVKNGITIYEMEAKK